MFSSSLYLEILDCFKDNCSLKLCNIFPYVFTILTTIADRETAKSALKQYNRNMDHEDL